MAEKIVEIPEQDEEMIINASGDAIVIADAIKTLADSFRHLADSVALLANNSKLDDDEENSGIGGLDMAGNKIG